MASPFRNLKSAFRRLIGAKTVTLDGVTVSTDPAVVSRQVRSGIFKETYEEPERILIREGLRPGDRVLEIGGGVGFVSLLCARIVGADNVLTYEANPAMHKVIRANYALNGLEPRLRGRALTAHGGDVTFFVNDNIISSSVYQREGGRAVTVPSDAIDAALAEWRPTVLVMDVEGAEVDILAASALPGLKRIVLELHPHVVGPEAVARLRAHLSGLGFHEARAVQKSSLFSRGG
jgi:FkbM family methyltransferase